MAEVAGSRGDGIEKRRRKGRKVLRKKVLEKVVLIKRRFFRRAHPATHIVGGVKR